MKIILITQGTSPIVKPIYNTDHNVVGIVESAPRFCNSPKSRVILKTYNLVLSSVGKPKRLVDFCKKERLPYFYFDKSNSDECQRFIQKLKPDLIVVYSMSQLLSEEIFSIPKYGTINLHPSLLPNYRGPNPYFWMYYNMEKIGGVTVHYINKGEDTGDIILQDTYEIPLGMNLKDMVHIAIYEKGIPILLDAINMIEQGNVKKIEQPKLSPTMRAKNISNNEIDEIINWQEDDVTKVWHILNGYSDRYDLISQPKGIYWGQKWEFIGYSLEKHDHIPSKNVIRSQNKNYLYCKNGIIHLNVRINIFRLIVKALS